MHQWPALHPDFEHHHGRPIDNYNLGARPMSQPSMPPQPATAIVQVCTDAKPRLTKDQHEILEAHFRQQPKPSTSTKKGYAENLGVPLDKINNWFQNRRAKVKQEAKKAANQMQLYHSLGHHPGQFFGHHQQVAAPLPFMCGPPPVVPSNTDEPSHAPQNTMATQNPNLMQVSMSAAEMNMQAPVMTSAPQHDMATFDAQGFSAGMSGQPLMLSEFNFGPSFQDDMFNGTQTYDFMQMPESMMAPVSMASMANHAMPTPPIETGSPATMPQLTAAYVPHKFDEEDQVKLQVDSPQDVLDFSSSSGHPTPADSTTTWSSVAPDMFEKFNASTPALVQSQESPASVDSYDRRESSALAESVNNVAFGSSSDTESSFKVPPQISGLAARRQKPRPANLAPTAFRSASFTAGMPGSPSGTATPNSQDQLRRIRSHGINVPTGRISKTGGPQKSPLHATFDAAAVSSPKFARHASNYSVSTINSSGPLTATTMPNSLAPPTPITPNEFSRFPIGQVAGFGFSNGSPSAFSHMGDEIYLDASSPMGKLDMHQMEQFRAHQMARDEASMFQTPPQSAPAYQQHFGFQPQARMFQPPTSHVQGHVRRISLPDSQHGQEVKRFQPQMSMHLSHSGQQMGQPQLGEAFNAEPNNFSMGQSMQMQQGAGMEMPVQLIVPQQADSRLPIHFHNQTPEDYQKAMRS